MRTSILKRTTWTVATLLVLLVGCKKSIDVVTSDAEGCQLQTERTGDQTTTHTYNSLGQRVRSVASSSGRTPIVYTYSYNEAGNIISATTQGTGINVRIDNVGTYEYTGGRLTKITSKSSGDLPTMIDTYSYDDSGRIATHTYTSSGAPSVNSTPVSESYTFSNGVLTSGAIAWSGQSLTVTVANGRITGLDLPNGSKRRLTYDANGYNTRTDYLDKAGILQSYTINEYNTTPYKKASSPYNTVPTVNVYGNTELPLSREAIYDANGTLKAETRYQYQINSEGYLTALSYEQNQPNVGNGQIKSSTTYTYSNCQ